MTNLRSTRSPTGARRAGGPLQRVTEEPLLFVIELRQKQLVHRPFIDLPHFLTQQFPALGNDGIRTTAVIAGTAA
ncbi:hypothetical protein D3C86_2130730 [compost metagenome]